MKPDEAAVELLRSLRLPEGSATVLTWHDGPVALRIWVDERYLWYVKKNAPQEFSGYPVNIEVRPMATAHKSAGGLLPMLTYPIAAMTATLLRCAEPLQNEDAFLAREMTDEEFESYVRVSNSDLPVREVEFFSPAFADE